MYLESGQFGKAGSASERAAALVGSSEGYDELEIIVSLNLQGTLLSLNGRYREAEDLLVHALDRAERRLGVSHLQVAYLLKSLGNLCVLTERWSVARRHYERALAIVRQCANCKEPLVGRYLTNLAAAYRGMGQPGLAERTTEEALQIFEASLGREHPLVAAALRERALALRQLKRGREARQLENRAQDITAKTLRDNHINATVDIRDLSARPDR